MTGDLASMLAVEGIRVPELEPLPLAVGVTAVGFAAEGDEALVWWRRLRAVHHRTGFWPVVIPSVEEAVDASGAGEAEPAQRVARAAALDGSALLNPGGVTVQELDERGRQELLERWPEDEPSRLEGFGLPYRPDGQPAPVLVALVEAEHGWQLPPLLDYGFWNDCPEPAVHGAALRHWKHLYGAELVCMSSVSLELALARPPRTRLDALGFAQEYALYCLDGMARYDADDIPDLAACLLDAETVRFWWD